MKLNCITKLIVKQKENMQWDNSLKQINVLLIKISVFTFLQFYNLNAQTWFYFFSSLLAVLTTIFVILFFIRISKIQRKPREK